MTTDLFSHLFQSRSTFCKGRRVLLLAGLSMVVGVSVAHADCNTDVGGYMKRREAAVLFVNKAKAANGKLDPTLACPRLRSLNAVENEAVAYFNKNKDWCNLPSDLVDRMNDSAKRTATFAGQACAFAAKVKQMQQQAQQQQQQQQQEMAPKLPTGPL